MKMMKPTIQQRRVNKLAGPIEDAQVEEVMILQDNQLASVASAAIELVGGVLMLGIEAASTSIQRARHKAQKRKKWSALSKLAKEETEYLKTCNKRPRQASVNRDAIYVSGNNNHITINNH